jgi:hypothetical protein
MMGYQGGMDMKLALSRITKGFALVGFMIGLLADASGAAYWLGSDAIQESISNHAEIMLWLCPPSFGFMALERATALDVAEIYALVIVLNTLIYGVAGLAISQVYHLGKRLMQPRAA